MTSPWGPISGPGPHQSAYPYPGGYPAPRGTNGLAIAALVLGLLCCAPLALVFGIIALVQTGDGRQAGRGLAIAGVLLSLSWVAIGVVVAVVASVTDGFLVLGTTDSSPLVRVGECFEPDINRRISCAQPHSDEVFAVLELSRFPSGDDDDKLLARCRAELPKYSRSASHDPSIQVGQWGPGTDWKYMHNHTTACVAHSSPNRVGSIRGDRK